MENTGIHFSMQVSFAAKYVEKGTRQMPDPQTVVTEETREESMVAFAPVMVETFAAFTDKPVEFILAMTAFTAGSFIL